MRWLLLFYLFFEVLCTLSVGEAIGGIGLFLEIILSALIGMGILLNFRYYLGETIEALRVGRLSSGEFIGMNILRVLGAFLLILPGILSDIIGSLVQMGIFGTLFTQVSKCRNPRGFTNMRTGEYMDTQEHIKGEIIDVEVIETSEKGEAK
ncbi:MAG: FxsA family protein [Wolinella sp.]